MNRTQQLSTALVFGAIMLAGCGPQIEPYELGAAELKWEVAPVGCEQSGVREVEITLENETGVHRQHFDCSRQSGVMDDVAPGLWEARFDGLDAEGTVRYSGHLQELMIRPAERTVSRRIDLVAVSGGADVRWSFSGTFGCAVEGLSQVEVAVFDDGHHQVYRRRVDCDKKQMHIDGLHGGEHLFRIRAEGHQRLFEGRAEETIEGGVDRSIDVELTPLAEP